MTIAWAILHDKNYNDAEVDVRLDLKFSLRKMSQGPMGEHGEPVEIKGPPTGRPLLLQKNRVISGSRGHKPPHHLNFREPSQSESRLDVPVPNQTLHFQRLEQA
jgi:hypothetical protein